MKKVIGFSLVCAAMLHASEATLEPLTVESSKLSDVSGEEIKSADLAEALATKLPNINLIRRSGIANDILLRGQKRDNINVTIDGTKINGACPNRMDPPTSHVVTHNVESVEVIEGPYNVEDFGTLSGSVEVTMKEPTENVEGEVSLNLGSFGYKKAAGSISGGNDRVQLMIVGSKEVSDQYKDGDGNTLAEQTDNKAPAMNKYQPAYHEMKAYEKQSFMGKINVNVTDDQQLKLSYTDNQSDDVLYPNSGMDALYDNSKIYNAEYIVRNLGSYSKKLNLQAYQSEVDHPMSTEYRNNGAMHIMVNHLTTETQGVKLKNSFDAADTAFTIGLDASNRNWDGHYTMDGTVTGPSIDDADTENRALFIEAAHSFGDLNLKAGVRYDNTQIESSNAALLANEYNDVSGNIYATYKAADATTIFGGIGKSIRVPDARELYFQKGMAVIGTDDLDATKNYEVDLGIEQRYAYAKVKLKTFYSFLEDYIYFNSGKSASNFENINATIYGAELSASYNPIDALGFDFGMAYLRGQKEEALAGQTDKDLADIPPLKANASISYYYGEENYARIELVSALGWDTYDSDNGEQKIGGYGVVNLKLSHDIDRHWNLTAGVDNVMDQTYAVSNTYMDLTLLSIDSTTPPMLLNEPGRYFYVNATFSF